MAGTAVRRKGTAGDRARPSPGIRHTLRTLIARYTVFTRYAAGSVLAAITSEVALLVTYGTGMLGPRAASVAGWAAGAVVNYVLNRWWAWGRRGRASLWRELVPYWAITLTSLAVSAWATGLADRTAPRLFASGSLRLAFVGAAFIAVYGVMFFLKFVLYHYVVFGGRSGRAPAGAGADAAGGADRAEHRSRHHVPTTTRR